MRGSGGRSSLTRYMDYRGALGRHPQCVVAQYEESVVLVVGHFFEFVALRLLLQPPHERA
jgi:hypothetical protein